YEACLEEALGMALAHRVRVLLYNGRGVGRSLGRELTCADEVVDCEAVLRYAAQHSEHVAVVAFSLGAAVCTVALGRLRRAGVFAAAEPGLLVSRRSFTNLAAAAARLCVAAPLVPAMQGLLRGLLFVTGADPLDAAQVLRTTRVARKVVITGIEDDDVIGDGARLAQGVAPGSRTANRIEYISRPGCDHDDFAVETADVEASIRRWRASCAPY
ncbi:MAG: alpha/beta fold hydrolase, partial [Deltaproteobacteria bacterium]